MDLQVPNANLVAEYCRRILSDVLDELVNQVPNGLTNNWDNVKQSLRSITNMYQNGLRYAHSNFRSDWNDPANRCAYVFVYLMQHCYLVNGSLQYSDVVAKSWRNKSNLKVCSIGGGPGSDLVGVTIFLRENRIFPPSLECLVLDLYPTWKDTWDTIYRQLPGSFTVSYRECDLVRDTKLRGQDLQFVKQADILTLSKSFSAVSAFFRQDRSGSKGNFLRNLLRATKPGCFVLYIDNDYVGCTQFQQNFASRAGLDMVFEFRGKPTCPSGQYSHTIRKYCQLFDFRPMRTCNVIIQLFRKKGSVQSAIGDNPTESNLARTFTEQATVAQVPPSAIVAGPSRGRPTIRQHNPKRVQSRMTGGSHYGTIDNSGIIQDVETKAKTCCTGCTIL
ncbi:uncharacterized protein LOC110973245 [Acanthaster planci]|uniref:Uncharacterized protein LOC110973245 n=1 Tax=Acanthaster planci TaxID=133434 RepID=A0A8B7XFS1_ACAPL|nr:uncharacterized protein LOC110973245 [Acanthaster planci]XP_022079620.1 uncharacterized protein LOC110973245 [Acanthaster planci]